MSSKVADFLNLSLSLLTTSDDPKIRMQSLRLLINLSTNENMVKHLLTSKVSNRKIIPRLHNIRTDNLINTNHVFIWGFRYAIVYGI